MAAKTKRTESNGSEDKIIAKINFNYFVYYIISCLYIYKSKN
jgi:hypothetical protein